MNTFFNPVSGVTHHDFTVIMSAWTTYSPADFLDEGQCGALNEYNHKVLCQRVMDIVGHVDFTECQGVYDGTSEQSVICSCRDVVEVMHLFELGKNYSRECILVVDHRAAVAGLMYMDGQVSRIGKNLVEACDTVKGDYTQIGNKRYVVA